MDKTRIIVVEDNIVYCQYVCNLLMREGYSTVQAYHLSTAKKHLQQATDDDIVVSDLRLPDGNGIDLLRWMRKEGKLQPFIIMTDYTEVHTAVESMKLGSFGLHTQTTCGRQTRPPYPLHTEGASGGTPPYAHVRP